MKIKRILIMTLIVSLIFSMFYIPTSAATKGSNQATVINVTTQANWLKSGSESITLTPKSGTKTNGSKFEGSWEVKVYRYKNGTTKTYKLNNKYNGASLKISLARNEEYKITVTPTAAYKASCATIQTTKSLKTYPSWYVSKTNKISSIK